MPSDSFDPTSTPNESPSLASPRIHHVAGALAPAMSPLDVFAAQSRALAKQLEEQQRNGNRGSRLPPLMVKDGLAKIPQYYRPPSLEGRSKSRDRIPKGASPISPVGNHFDIEEPSVRPHSHYTRYSNVESIQDVPSPQLLHGTLSRTGNRSGDTFSKHMHRAPEASSNYFEEAQRPPSPERMRYLRARPEMVTRPDLNGPKKSFDSVSQRSMKSELDRGLSVASSTSYHSTFSGSHALLPPNPPYARKTPSIRSVDSEDDNPGITPSSSWEHRKLSSSSGFSAPTSPVHSLNQAQRSPSMASESSLTGHRSGKLSHNFSRPMSRSSRPSIDVPSRMSSTDDHLRNVGEDGMPSVESSGYLPDHMDGDRPTTPGGTTYVYSKWSLPRGRMLRRSEQLDGPNMGTRPTESADAMAGSEVYLPTPPRSFDLDRPARSSLDILPRPPPIPASKLQNRHSLISIKTSNTESTIKGSQHTVRPSEELTAEDHLNKGIECHERGSLNESTYHLRLAARQNNPTAMLLYALACRHGWGMRPNPSEGVNWLRKAMDCASIELAHEDISSGQPQDFEGRKTRKAQFALSVYELGVSHMNGWGIVQDKSLALRCFEIASSWGDADAMSEAGFCYAQGVGCRKDLKKAAKYYRSAEARGVSMVGNSWCVLTPSLLLTEKSTDYNFRIYKSKYADSEQDASSSKPDDRDRDDRSGRSTKQPVEKEKKTRDKSRTRSLFGRKKG